ncbi:MAG: hypothetical protein JWM99_4928, partial [Verrucomicrobiales bacterium]|nr:hypothetical protein [Verrucomicrobiales bacterium]
AKGAECNIEPATGQFRGNPRFKKLGQAGVVQIDDERDNRANEQEQRDAKPAEYPPELTPSTAFRQLNRHGLFGVWSHKAQNLLISCAWKFENQPLGFAFRNIGSINVWGSSGSSTTEHD